MGHLGAQKDPAAYGLPAEAEGDAKSYLQGLQNAAAEAGVPKRIWDKFANSFTGLHKKVEEQRASDLASGREKLKDVLIGKYGAKAESVLQRAEKRLGEIFGGDATIAERMRAAGLSNELAFVEGLISVDRVLSDDTLPQNRVAINSSAPTDLLDAAKKAKSIGQSPALHNFRHKDHAAANKEFEDCMRVVAAAGHKTPAAAIAAANKSRK